MDLALKYDDPTQTHYAHCNALKAANVAETGEFSGHAAIFGNVDQGGDMIIEGAFTETLRLKEFKVKILFNHDSMLLPIGHPLEMVEDKIGLFVRGLLNMKQQLARDVRESLLAEDIEGLSIGFRVRKGGAEFDEDTGIFKLMSLILREFSIVTFPMNLSADVTGIKSELQRIDTLRQFEQFLCDTTHFTKRQATAIAAHGFDADKSNGGELQLGAALDAIKTFNAPTRFGIRLRG
ncbi:MAG: HK97 family phage prohead protease [Proteobacteria bacterium]|nr:HK97 family phage prohead protease [Pseudomonadota bacterium]